MNISIFIVIAVVALDFICLALASGLPNPELTPSAININATQENINRAVTPC